MNNVVALSDYRKGPMMKDVQISVDKLSLYTSHNSLLSYRSLILNSLPEKSLNLKKLFVPFVYDAEPLWLANIEQGCFNHKYEPYAMLLYVIKYHHRELFDYCNGVVIDSQYSYNYYQDIFNHAFTSALDKVHREYKRGITVDDMIRMGSIFLLLLRSCDKTDGLIIDYDRRFLNPWNGIRNNHRLLFTHLTDCSKSLDNVYMSGLHWQTFLFRYINDTDSESLWFFNLPEIEDRRDDDLEQEISKDEMFSMFDSLIAINKRGGKILMTLKDSPQNVKFLKEFFSFIPIGGGRYKNKFLTMDRNNGEGLMLLSNYKISTKTRKVGD